MTESNELVPIKAGREMTVADLRDQVNMIRDAMKSVMVENTHFGKIPGCGDKQALLQPGAHKLGLMFNLAPEYRIDVNHLADDHREYEVVCLLTRRSDGLFIGQGVGVCSTRESKYRFRWDNTGEIVPKEYWKERNKELIGGNEFVPRKVDGNWLIFQRIDHDNPADYYNTVKKIAKKRAYNDAILTATAASDIFVPDDDLPDNFIHPDEPAAEKKTVQQPQAKQKPAGNGKVASEKQRKMISAVLGNAGIGKAMFENKFGPLDELPIGTVDEALHWIKDYEPDNTPAWED